MANEDKVKYWIDLSDEDLKVGRTLLYGGHFLYVAFMCHQAIEIVIGFIYRFFYPFNSPVMRTSNF
ncbi:hypothetical protein AGMMS4957_03900 [Bacteroidia bacterium]|nr:hypothetical protein AGMMS4957_03900 [Bacteroidia bacterium]